MRSFVLLDSWRSMPQRAQHLVVRSYADLNGLDIEFYGDELSFAAGHFTIFSKTERETLHGHNYSLQARLTAGFNQPGITFDYRIFRKKLINLCKQLQYRTLLPTKSPYLLIESDKTYHYAEFNHEKMIFLQFQLETIFFS